uniref:Uncharacterized protein n=1 Tax=Strigamia maritima TaxID=126957 RepID=T1J0G7_STRMM
METETPLDVLSRAASLLDSQVMPCTIVAEQDTVNTSSVHDLPRRGVKSRRKERRDLEYSSIKLRTRRTAGTQTKSVCVMQETNDPETEEDSMSSSEVAECESNTEEENCDSPLDMTTTNRNSTSPSCDLNKRNSAISSSQFVMEQQRPSVITCTSALMQRKKNISSDISRNSKKSDVKHGHRREVLSGMCDPVIDEHFRRSLGKDYPEMFSGTQVTNTVTESGLSVHLHDRNRSVGTAIL